MRKFMSHMRTLEKFEWVVLGVLCIALGICVGFTCGGLIGEFFESRRDVEIAFTRDEPSGELSCVSAPRFEEGKIVSIFTAERGTMVGKNKYRFEKARLTEFFAGTSKVKAVMSADTAIIEEEGGVILSASWHGNFKRRQFMEKK